MLKREDEQTFRTVHKLGDTSKRFVAFLESVQSNPPVSAQDLIEEARKARASARELEEHARQLREHG